MQRCVIWYHLVIIQVWWVSSICWKCPWWSVQVADVQQRSGGACHFDRHLSSTSCPKDSCHCFCRTSVGGAFLQPKRPLLDLSQVAARIIAQRQPKSILALFIQNQRLRSRWEMHKVCKFEIGRICPATQSHGKIAALVIAKPGAFQISFAAPGVSRHSPFKPANGGPEARTNARGRRQKGEKLWNTKRPHPAEKCSLVMEGWSKSLVLGSILDTLDALASIEFW